jgi:hypothetical protein
MQVAGIMDRKEYLNLYFLKASKVGLTTIEYRLDTFLIFGL